MGTTEKKAPVNLNLLLAPVLNQVEIPEIYQILDSMQNPEYVEQAAKALYDVLSQNPGHSLSPYLKECPKNFTGMVINALERVANPNQNAGGDNFQVPEQVHAQTQRFLSRPMTTQTQSTTQTQNQGSLNRSFEQGDQSARPSTGNNLEDFHNKVNNLKMRYGLIMRNENPSNSNSNPNQAQNLQVLNSKMSALNQVNGQDPEITTRERRHSTTGVGQHKSTENILQKLSEMKMRMANIVNSGNKNPTNPNGGN